MTIRLLAAMLAVLAASRTLQAAPQPPEALIRSAVQQTLQVLRDPELQAPERRSERVAKLRKIADGVFDWSAMAQSSLGAYWRKLDDAQRAEFVDVFQRLLAREYIEDLDRFTGHEEVVVKGEKPEPPLRVVDTTLITASHERVPINYVMRLEGERWVGIDVEIQGVSLVNHYRATFRRFLVNHSFDALLERLRGALPAEQ
jgi:phospholipid transport system substrate-binding protein